MSKVRELRMLLATGFDAESAAVKLGRYRKSLEMLDREIPGARIVELLRLELEALENLPPEPARLERTRSGRERRGQRSDPVKSSEWSM